MEALDRFAEIVQKPRDYLMEWKSETNGKVIGCYPMYVPEEIIHAAKALPVTLLGSDESVTLAETYLHSFLCHPVRSNFDHFLKGGLDFVDGLVFPDICDQEKRVASVWRLHSSFPLFHFIGLPKRLNSTGGKEHLIRELTRLRSAIEDFCHKKIQENELRSSISIYNESRSLLGQIYKIRRDSPGALSTAELSTVVTAGMLMPKEEYNALLSDYIRWKQDHPSSEEDSVRLAIVGNPCEDLEPGMGEMIEGLGGVVVDDDIFTGGRYFGSPVPEEGDPLNSLAEGYLQGMACPTKHDTTRTWADHVLSVFTRSKASGVVVLLPKNCEIYAFEYPYLRKRLNESSVPHIMLECDHRGVTGATRTRLEAFMEMLKGE